MSQAVIPDWATPENRKQIRQRLSEVTVMRTFDLPHRGAKYRQIAKLMGLPDGLSREETIARINDGIDYLNATKPRPSRIAMCHHEAGHAVVANALGIKIKDVCARAIKDSAGRCSIAEKQQQRWLATADGRLRWCTMSAAGSIAELRYLRLFRQPFDAECWQVGHGQDQEEIMTIIVAGLMCDSSFAAAYASAERLVTAHWPRIRCVAMRLYKNCRDLRGEELAVYLRRPSPHRHVPLRYGLAWPHDVLAKRKEPA